MVGNTKLKLRREDKVVRKNLEIVGYYIFKPRKRIHREEQRGSGYKS